MKWYLCNISKLVQIHQFILLSLCSILSLLAGFFERRGYQTPEFLDTGV